MKKITLVFFTLFVFQLGNTQTIDEGFDDITTLTGWDQVNVSSTIGTTNWFQGNPDTFPSFDGDPNSYIGANFNATTGTGTINNFLISPVVSLSDGDEISFYTRAPISNFPDRLELRLSTDGAGSTNPDGSASVGSYTVLLEEVNPGLTVGGYPETWTKFTVSLSGIGNNTDCRVAFRYWVTNGGPTGANSNYIGIDRVFIGTPPTCQIPSGFAINDISINTADIGWTDNNGPGTTFDIEWGEAGFLLGAGNQINGLTNPSYEFSGLEPDTLYSLFVTANCTGGNGSSSQVGPIQFLTAFDCSTFTVPYNETFDNNNKFISCFSVEDIDGNSLSWITQQDLDLDGDTIPETFATNATGAATGSNVNDWMISPGLSFTSGTEYQLTTAYNILGGSATGSLEAFIIDAPSSAANVVATLFSNTNFTTQGAFETLETNAYQEVNTFTPITSGTYYIAYRSFGPNGGGFILLFDSILEISLSTDEQILNAFSHHYDKVNERLEINHQSFNFENVEIFNALGQIVLRQELSANHEQINVNQISSGVYVVNVKINGLNKTFKFIKS